MRIGEVASKSGVSVRSLRYYEEQHLLNSTRSPSGQRHYGEDAIGRVQMIQMFFGAGLTSRTIQDVLPCVDLGVSTKEANALLLAERERIDRQMAGLAAARSKLEEIIAIAFDPTLPCIAEHIRRTP